MAFEAGGTMVLSYTNGTDRWEQRITLSPFDPATLLYTGTGIKHPTERGIADTYYAWGMIWAAYYDPTWSLTLEALYWRDGADAVPVALPALVPITGAYPTPTPAAPPIRRSFTFTTALGKKHRVHFFGIGTNGIGTSRQCGVSTGGFDARDQAAVAYISGPDSAIVAWDGEPFPPAARVYERFLLRPFEQTGPMGPAGPVGPTGPAGADAVIGDCIAFPLGATLCNDGSQAVHLHTPSSVHAWDLSGYGLPGGHRLEVSPP